MKFSVIDNGGSMIRVGLSGDSAPKIVRTNAIARGKKDKKIHIGEKIHACPEYLLHRPVNRGLVEDWQAQKFLWQSVLSKKQNFSNTAVATIAPFAPAVAKRDMYDVLFRDFGFEKAVILESSLLGQFSPGITSQFTPDDWANPCGLLIDVGFSQCTVIPVFNTQPIPKASIRLPVGGRILNNILRERVNLQVELDDNPLLIQHIRELGCACAPSREDFKNIKPSVVQYVLPDFSENSSFGHLGTGDPSVKLGRDQFAVCEAIFSPSTFGIDKIGLAECVHACLQKCPPPVRDAVAQKIILFGGLAKIPGFIERLRNELSGSPRIISEADGQTDLSIWRGAANFVHEDLEALGLITRQDWLQDFP